MVSASAFSAACFCYLFGGSAVDAFTALAPGFAVGLFTRALARVRTPLNKLVSNMLSAGVVALVSLACVQALGLAGVSLAGLAGVLCLLYAKRRVLFGPKTAHMR